MVDDKETKNVEIFLLSSFMVHRGHVMMAHDSIHSF